MTTQSSDLVRPGVAGDGNGQASGSRSISWRALELDRLFSPFRPPLTNLVDHLRYWVDQQPNAIAFYYLVDGEDDELHLTYAELDEKARAIAQRLLAMGMHNERALLLYPPGLDFICGFFGCLYAGVVPVPAFPPRRNRNMGRIQAISDDAQASVALTVSDVAKRIDGFLSDAPSLARLKWLATDQVPSDDADDWTPPEITPSTVALLQYTSGSTGTPKGVVLTHGNLLHNCALIAGAFEFSRTGCGMTWLPTYHDMGLLGGVLSPLFFGRPNVLMSPMAFLQKPVRWLRAITRYQVTVSGGPNFAYALCNEKITPDECEGLDLRTWDVAFNGAEPIRPETLEEFNRKFGPYGFRAEAHYPCYGMAETTLIVTGGVKQQLPVIRCFDGRQLEERRAVPCPPDSPNARRLVGCGRVLPDEEIRIVDPDRCVALDDGRVGEIWVRSPSVGLGYWNKPNETREIFGARLDGDDPGTWLRTGDLGFLHEGELFVTGRIKDMIIVRGVNRYPQDIEATVERASPRLRTGGAAAFAVEADGRERLVIVCEVERSRHVVWDEVIAAIRRDVTAEHEVPPDAIVLVRAGSIPKTSSGKIQRHACRDQFLSGELVVVHQWIGWQSQAETQETGGETDATTTADIDPAVVQIVMDHVRAVAKDRAAHLDLDSNIVTDLGLDSLERLQIATLLEDTFGGRFPDDVLQRVETCREVAMAVQQHMGTQPVESWETASAAADGNGAAIPPAYYLVDRFPEYVRLQQTRGLLESAGVASPFFRTFEGPASHVALVDGCDVINFATYDYLGLSTHPDVRAAAKAAIDQYGVGTAGNRVVAGNRPVHRQLEQELAEFLGTEDAIVFASGHAANQSTIGHLFGQGDLILYDRLAHNSIVKGAELSGARRRPFDHHNPAALEQLLRELRPQFRRVLIALDGLHGIDGDYPDLPRFIELKQRYRAMLLLDDAHSLGTLGLCGRGLVELFDAAPAEIDIWTGSLSKALGSCGGFIAGSRPLIDYLRYTAPAFVYATSIAPPVAAAALAALRLLRREPERVALLQANACLFSSLVRQRGLRASDRQPSPIVPIVVGNSLKTLQLAERLFARGVLAQPIVYPAVADEDARLRFFITLEHTEDDIRTAVDALSAELQLA